MEEKQSEEERERVGSKRGVIGESESTIMLLSISQSSTLCESLLSSCRRNGRSSAASSDQAAKSKIQACSSSLSSRSIRGEILNGQQIGWMSER